SKYRLQAAAEQHSPSEKVSEPATKTELRLFTHTSFYNPFIGTNCSENAAPTRAHALKETILIPLLVPLYGSRSGQKEVMRLETAQDDLEYERLDAREWQEREKEHERVLDELYAERSALDKMYDELKGLKDWKQCSKYKNLESRIEKENRDFTQRKAEKLAKERKV
ncbi:MAG: hypothetical protein Q9204_009259, partial [Flavoplaca sp. TL-2023a]